MKHSIFLVCLLTTAINLSASFAGGLVGAAGELFESCRWKTQEEKLSDAVIHHDAKKIQKLCAGFSQDAKNAVIDISVAKNYGKNCLKPTEQDRREAARRTLLQTVREDTDPKQEKLGALITLFTYGLPHEPILPFSSNRDARTFLRGVLHAAAETNNLPAVRRLMRECVELVDECNDNSCEKDYPIHAAARSSRDSVECLKVLVAQKANIYKRNGNGHGKTAIDLATQAGNYKQLAWLLSQLKLARKQLSQKDYNNLWSLLMDYSLSSRQKGISTRLQTMRVLLEYHIPVNPNLFRTVCQTLKSVPYDAQIAHEVMCLHEIIHEQDPRFNEKGLLYAYGQVFSVVLNKEQTMYEYLRSCVPSTKDLPA